MWRSCFALDKYAGFPRTITMTKYISAFLSTLNPILSVTNLSRLECAETPCIRVHVINKTAREHSSGPRPRSKTSNLILQQQLEGFPIYASRSSMPYVIRSPARTWPITLKLHVARLKHILGRSCLMQVSGCVTKTLG